MKKKWILIIPIVMVAVLIVYFVINKNNEISIKIGEKKVTLIGIADSEEERNKGLSGTTSLCEDCAMLFIYDKSGIYPHWMKQMNYDLDMIWINGNKVVDITENAKKPFLSEYDKPTMLYYGNVPYEKVLEVNAGFVKENQIFVGDKISN